MNAVSAYAAAAPNAPLVRTTIPRRAVGERDVLLEIKYCGICHTDIHQVRGDWGESIFPMVPGHEISGIVVETGDRVRRYRAGDRVGVGCFVGSCRTCAHCLADQEQYCLQGPLSTYNAMSEGAPTYGGYSTHIVVDEHFVLRIPDGIGLAEAAPLMCAGISVFSPLNHWHAGRGKSTAVVGLGGLGHLGVKVARAMGAEVTVLSRSSGKEEDALRLGASRFLVTSDPARFAESRGSFDLIVNTVSANVDLDAYLGLLKLDGTMVNIGVPEHPNSFGMFSLIGARRSLAGSLVGGVRETQEMLDFCAARGIGAEIEVIGADEINEAYKRVVDGDVRYRFVIDAASFAR
nr:NAD(P)-dependent alcohol dehydrogenase [Amycolatopsis anabasis]